MNYTEKPDLGPLTKQAIFDIESSPFDLDKYCLYAVISGSHAYGTNVETSDVDIRGITSFPEEYIYGLNKIEQIENQKKDICFYGLWKMISLLYKSNVHALEMIFIEPKFVQISTPISQELTNNRCLFMTKMIGYSFGGYANQQRKILETKRENKTGRISLVEKFGYDTKFAAHMVRLFRSGSEALLTGYLQVYRSDKEELLSIRSGLYTYEDFLKMADEEEIKFNEAWEKSKLPEKPDFEKINRLLIKLQKETLNNL